MHRSVPRTHTSTAFGGRMGLRPKGYWTRVLEGVLSACAGDERYAGALEDTNGPAQQRRSHAGARRGIARGAGAQDTQLIERRQRGGDRAVQLVRVEIPATCTVRPAVQRNAHAPVCGWHTHQHITRWPTWVFVPEGTAHGYSRGCCTCALFVPGRRKSLQPCRGAHTPSTVRVRILEWSLATPTHGPVVRRYAHGGGKGHLRTCAHTRPHEAH